MVCCIWSCSEGTKTLSELIHSFEEAPTRHEAQSIIHDAMADFPPTRFVELSTCWHHTVLTLAKRGSRLHLVLLSSVAKRIVFDFEKDQEK